MPLVSGNIRGLPDMQRKAFLFDNVTDPKGGATTAAAVGVLGASRKIYKMALGLEENSAPGKWRSAGIGP